MSEKSQAKGEVRRKLIQSLAHENRRLRGALEEARSYIGGMPTLDCNGDDRFLMAARVVHNIEAALSLGQGAEQKAGKS
jgi:hypothetical protein